MEKIQKIILSVLVLLLMVTCGSIGALFGRNIGGNTGGLAINAPTFYVSSSTAFVVTTSTSLRLLATSTKRVAYTIEPLACPTNGGIFLNADSDKAATTSAGIFAFASTTLNFGTYPNALPSIIGAVQGVAGAAGTCQNVLVTEWRTQY